MALAIFTILTPSDSTNRNPSGIYLYILIAVGFFTRKVVWRSGAQSATTAGTSAPPEVRSTSGHMNHDVQSWFAPINFCVCRERFIRFPFCERSAAM